MIRTRYVFVVGHRPCYHTAIDVCLQEPSYHRFSIALRSLCIGSSYSLFVISYHFQMFCTCSVSTDNINNNNVNNIYVPSIMQHSSSNTQCLTILGHHNSKYIPERLHHISRGPEKIKSIKVEDQFLRKFCFVAYNIYFHTR